MNKLDISIPNKNDIGMKILSKDAINTPAVAADVLHCFQKYGFKFRKIGRYEPLRTNYSEELFIQYWCQEKVLSTLFGTERIFGGVIASFEKLKGDFTVLWTFERDKGKTYIVSHAIHVTVPNEYVKKNLEKFDALFEELLSVLHVDFASIATQSYTFSSRKFFSPDNQSTIDRPLYQAIHWRTYLSNARLAEIQPEFDKIAWPQRKDLPDGVLLKLSDTVPMEGDPIEEQGREYTMRLWGPPAALDNSGPQLHVIVLPKK